MIKFLKAEGIPYRGIPEDEEFSRLYDEAHDDEDDEDKGE